MEGPVHQRCRALVTMSNRWPGCMKIHEGCGGLVRWVEAVQTPGVGYFGECSHCHADRLPVEQIVPVELPDGMREAEFVEQYDRDDYGDLYWDDDEDWETNQEQIAEALP